jgi:hypothetical protein
MKILNMNAPGIPIWKKAYGIPTIPAPIIVEI